MIELFTMVHNEAYLLSRMINFYRSSNPDIIINIYDNQSTDNTKEIGIKLNCNVFDINTEGLVDDKALLQFKNNIWKKSTADLVIIVDADEWVDMSEMRHIIRYGNPVWYRCTGYNMINTTHGVRYPLEDKVCVFSPKIKEINYSPGAHLASPQEGHQSGHSPILYHMKYTMPIDMVIAKYKDNGKRLSDYNKEHGLGSHYLYSEDTIRMEYNNFVKSAKKII